VAVALTLLKSHPGRVESDGIGEGEERHLNHAHALSVQRGSGKRRRHRWPIRVGLFLCAALISTVVPPATAQSGPVIDGVSALGDVHGQTNWWPGMTIKYQVKVGNNPTPTATTTIGWDVSGPCGYRFTHSKSSTAFTGSPTFVIVTRVLPFDACDGTYTFIGTWAVPGYQTLSATMTFTVDKDAPVTPPRPAMLYGESGAGVNPTGRQSDPVNSGTGAFTHAELDVSLPAIGVPIMLARSYNSNDPAVGPLGAGWNHSYDDSLTVATNGEVTYRTASGQQVVFGRNADGTYAPGAGVRATLSRAADGTYTVTGKDQTVSRFDAAGRLAAIRERNNQGLDLTYDGAGRLARVAGSGRGITFSYDPATGLRTKATLDDGRSVAYGYTAGRLTTAKDLGGATTTYWYDATGKLASIRDANNNYPVRNTYDPTTGRVTEQLDASDGRTTFSWDPSTGTASMTDPRGNAWVDGYLNGYLIRRTDPEGGVTRFSWDADMNLRRVTDPLGATTVFLYDGSANLLGRVTPAAADLSRQTERTGVNERNDVVSGGSFGLTSSNFGYDARGNLTNSTNVLAGSSTGYGFDARGLQTSVTDALLKSTTFVYDTAGNLTDAVAPLGERATFAYDASGRLTSQVDPRGNVAGANPADYRSTFVYDDADRVVLATNPLGEQTRAGYDPIGRLLTLTDAKNRVTTSIYDRANHVTSVQGPDPSIPPTTFTYDANGNLATRTDANLHTATFGYDRANRLTSASSPAGTWTFGYDADGHRTSVRDPANQTTQLSYDERGLLAGVTYSDGTPAVTFDHDALGRRSRMSSGGTTTSYAYDAGGWLSTVTRGSDVFRYGYDKAGTLTSRTFPGQAADTFTYDADGRMTAVVRGGVTIATYGYDAASQLTSTTLANGVVETRGYDRAGQLSEVVARKDAATVARSAYVRDEVGNPVQVTDASGTTTAYSYDALDRLTGACFASTTCPGGTDYVRWTYDGVSNRTSEIRPSGTTTFTYNAADRLTSQAGPAGNVAYTYDAAGNRTSAGAATFTWNAAGRMKTSKSGNTTTTYTYDGDGRRVSASTGTQAAKVANFLWDPASYQLAVERDGAGNVQRRYTYGQGPLSMTSSGADFYYHPDELGSILALTDSAGATQWSYRYEPYGKAKTETKVNRNAPINPMRFAGTYLDASGQNHLRARQYDAATGEFTSVDTAGSASAYGYAEANPMVYVDSLGTDARDFVRGLRAASGYVMAVGGLIAVAVACTPLVTCAGAVATFAAVLVGVGGTVHAGTSIALAYDSCARGKGSCVSDVVQAGLSVGVGGYGYGIMRLPAAGAGAIAGPQAIGFAPGEGASALTASRLQHGTRHLTDAGLLPTWRGTTSPGIIRGSLGPVLERPMATFDHSLGGTAVRGFLGELNGQRIAVFVFKEGPLQGQLATSYVPSAAQLAKWGF
jgi:RHS repeat-associated protein